VTRAGPTRSRERRAPVPRAPLPPPQRVPRAFASAATREADRARPRPPSLLSPARAAGILGMVVAVVAGFGLVAGPLFVLDRIDTGALRWTDRAAVVARLGVAAGDRLFGIDAAAAAARLVELPSIQHAEVGVALPDTLTVRVVEREPILVWRLGDATFLVDREGLLFASATGPDTAALPTVEDARASAVWLGVGSRLEPLDLQVASQLAAVTPADIGSRADALTFRIDDEDGFSMLAGPDLWVAVFGTYVPGLRTADLIPGQVRLLRSLLFGREATVARVLLADDRNGTYVARPAR